MNSTAFRTLLSRCPKQGHGLRPHAMFQASLTLPSCYRTVERGYYSDSQGRTERHGTTIVCVRKNGQVCMMADGMVSQGNMIIKPNVTKVRRILPKSLPSSTPGEGETATNNNGTLVGFAGSTADAFTLLERLEGKLDEFPGQLERSCVELAKGWRTDKYLRRLEAALVVADKKVSLEITGNGDVMRSHDGVLGVGSGSPYAIAAARALMDIPELSAEDVAHKAMNIAADMCVFTNKEFMTQTLQEDIPVTANEESVDTTTTINETIN